MVKFTRAVQTRFAPATDRRMSGVLVSAEGKRTKRYAWDHGASVRECHEAHARLYARTLGLGALVSVSEWRAGYIFHFAFKVPR